MKYILSAPDPSSHFIELEMIVDKIEADTLVVQLPAWRPGRYELGNFAKNIQRFKVTNAEGGILSFRKVTKDSWAIETKGSDTFKISYNYYAAQLDAGACWLDEDQLYVNPVHCFLYIAERIHEECVVELKTDFKQIATSLKTLGKKLVAGDFHELVDSPVIASNSLMHETYEEAGALFHLWIQGHATPDWEKIKKDFKSFTAAQFLMMKEFPFKEYHFLIELLPTRFYHGVEHLNSTVLALGQGYKLMEEGLYTDFVGVASHELFHAWNIKSIRPVEMMPYDYAKENYSRLGYVAEGVTTYYGDLFLLRCGVYSWQQYAVELNVRLQKHFDNYGRFNLSVADSSFDTWLDGYVPGIPDRKTSIYDEGCIIALMTDLLIRRHTQNKKSLDDVMRTLYYDFAKHKLGYSEQDYKRVVENTAGRPFDDFFSNYVYGLENYEPLLRDLLTDLGATLVIKDSCSLNESLFGFKAANENGIVKVSAIAPGSPSHRAGLARQEEIIAVNNQKVENNLDDLIRLYFASSETVTLHVISTQKKLRAVMLKSDGKKYYGQYRIEQPAELTAQQKAAFSAWSNKR